MSHCVIDVQNVTKIYKLYDSPKARLLEALNPFRKKYHRDFYALKDVSFQIHQGGSVGIVGMNGSGKSTLLQLITGVLNPTVGIVRTQGKISALLELGSGFNPEFTGLENVYFQCSILGFTKAEVDAKLSHILAFADIGDFIHQPVKTYSSGMYVRLAFSVAINVEPDILIIDEALAVGDMAFQTKCLRKIKEFKNQGKTLLFVSHDPGAVKTLCDRAILLHKGKVVDDGSPDKVFDYYNSLLAMKEGEDEKSIAESKEVDRVRSGSRKITIESVRIINSSGYEADTFVSGEVVSIEMRVQANEDVTDPVFGILIRDRLGNDIFGVNNSKLNIPVGETKNGESYSVRYTAQLDLGEGLYNLTVATHVGETHIDDNFDWINEVLVFRVVRSPEYDFVGCSRLGVSFAFKACPELVQ